MSDLNVLFCLEKTKTNRAGEAPIYGSVLLSGGVKINYHLCCVFF